MEVRSNAQCACRLLHATVVLWQVALAPQVCPARSKQCLQHQLQRGKELQVRDAACILNFSLVVVWIFSAGWHQGKN